jgi:hypothetical protein
VFRAKYDALYPNLSVENRSYLAALEYADQQIGRLIDHIDQQGLGEETLILIMSDNGPTGASDEELRDSYWVAMLSHLGCTGFAHDEGLMGAGDDRALRNATSMFSIDDPLPSARDALRRIAPNVSLARRVQVLAGILSDRTLFQRFQRAMCDTSIRLAEIVGAGPRILSALEQLCERWDGRGVPGRVEGESLLLPMRLQQMGHIIEIAHSRGQTLAQMAVAWVLRDQRVTSALVGASSVRQLDDTLAALDRLDFSDDELAAIDQRAVDLGINIWEESSAR